MSNQSQGSGTPNQPIHSRFSRRSRYEVLQLGSIRAHLNSKRLHTSGQKGQPPSDLSEARLETLFQIELELIKDILHQTQEGLKEINGARYNAEMSDTESFVVVEEQITDPWHISYRETVIKRRNVIRQCVIQFIARGWSIMRKRLRTAVKLLEELKNWDGYEALIAKWEVLLAEEEKKSVEWFEPGKDDEYWQHLDNLFADEGQEV